MGPWSQEDKQAMDKSTDPHSIYGYDPDTGAPRQPVSMQPVRARRPDRSGIVCVGCGYEISDGEVVMVTVTQAQHVITVPAHERHREAARASTLEDKSWQRDQSHYAG